MSTPFKAAIDLVPSRTSFEYRWLLRRRPCRQTAISFRKFWEQPLAHSNSWECVPDNRTVNEAPRLFFAPFMIHEALPTLTETASGSHPCCVISVTYSWIQCFHGGNTGSNPVGDANNPKELAEIGILPEGSEGSNKGKASLGLSHGSLRWQEHFHQFGLRGSFG